MQISAFETIQGVGIRVFDDEIHISGRGILSRDRIIVRENGDVFDGTGEQINDCGCECYRTGCVPCTRSAELCAVLHHTWVAEVHVANGHTATRESLRIADEYDVYCGRQNCTACLDLIDIDVQ